MASYSNQIRTNYKPACANAVEIQIMLYTISICISAKELIDSNVGTYLE